MSDHEKREQWGQAVWERSQLKETEAEDNILFFISRQFEIYFSYYSEISINEPRYKKSSV